MVSAGKSDQGRPRVVLTLEGPRGTKRQWRFDGTHPIQIGRAVGNDVQLDDCHVADYHATVFHDGREWTVCGLSCLGTYVNGTLRPSCVLLNGMVLQMGHHGPRLKIEQLR